MSYLKSFKAVAFACFFCGLDVVFNFIHTILQVNLDVIVSELGLIRLGKLGKNSGQFKQITLLMKYKSECLANQ